MVANRDRLHWNHLDALATFAATRGYTREPNKGPYDALRLRHAKGVLTIYARAGAREHVTVGEDAASLVHAFFAWRKRSGKTSP